MEDALLYYGYSTMLVDKLGARIGSPEMQSENFNLPGRGAASLSLPCSFVRAASGMEPRAPQSRRLCLRSPAFDTGCACA